MAKVYYGGETYTLSGGVDAVEKLESRTFPRSCRAAALGRLSDSEPHRERFEFSYRTARR